MKNWVCTCPKVWSRVRDYKYEVVRFPWSWDWSFWEGEATKRSVDRNLYPQSCVVDRSQFFGTFKPEVPNIIRTKSWMLIDFYLYLLSFKFLFRTMSTYNVYNSKAIYKRLDRTRLFFGFLKLLQLCQKVDIAFALIVGGSVTQGICCSIQVLTHRFEVSPLIQIHPMRACCNCFQTITVSQTKLVFLLFSVSDKFSISR